MQELNGGSITVGDVNISVNKFYGGDYGIDFFGEFYDLTDTTVAVGDVVINDNIFENQTSDAMDIDYYAAEYWYGTTAGTFGDLTINDNDITSAGSGCDAIDVDDYAYFEYFEDYASLTVGNLYIEGNEISVDGDGIYVYYAYTYELYDDASITMGDVSIRDNTIDSAYGIYLDYYDFGEYMYDDSEVVTGDMHIENNTIDADDEAIYLYYEYVAYDMDGDATFLMGDTYIVDNEISGDDDGIYIEYYDYYVGSYMYYDAYAELPSYIITGNTFDVEGDGIYFYTYSNPDDNEDNAMVDYGGFFIDDNTFGCDYGIYLYYEDVCEDCYDSSGAIIRDITITNNEFHDVDSDAIYIYFDDVGYCFDDDGTVEVGDMVISDNVIDGAGGCGVYVEYSNIYSEYDAMVTMGILDILRNDISNVGDDGVYVYYYIDADGDSTISIGRALIQENTIDGCGDSGIYMYMDTDNETGAVVNLGNPVIDNNTISNCSDGINLEDVEYATISNDTIQYNTNYGIYLESSSSNTLTSNTASDNSDWDIYIDDSPSNTFTDNTLNGTTVSFTYSGDVSLKGVGLPAAGEPGWYSIGKFISATNHSEGAWIFMNFSYSDSDFTGAMDESNLTVWKYNGTWYEDGWNGTRYSDTENNTVGVNITSFSVFAPMTTGVPALDHINVEPESALLNIDEPPKSQTFAATGRSKHTDPILDLMFGWSNTDTSVGGLNNSTGTVVNFTAERAGRAYLTASNGSVASGQVQVTVDGGADNATVANGTATATSGDATVTCNLGEGVNGWINITAIGNATNSFEVNSSDPRYGLGDGDKAVSGVIVNVSEDIYAKLVAGSTIRIRICYNDTTLAALGIDASTLAIWKYNSTTGWVKQPSTRSGTCVYVDVNHLCTFGLVGSKAAPTPSGGSSGGDGTYPPGWFGTPTPTVTATKAPAASATATATAAPPDDKATPAPTKKPAVTKATTPTAEGTAAETATEGAPGFTAVFAIAGMLAVAYAMMRRRG